MSVCLVVWNVLYHKTDTEISFMMIHGKLEECVFFKFINAQKYGFIKYLLKV